MYIGGDPRTSPRCSASVPRAGACAARAEAAQRQARVASHVAGTARATRPTRLTDTSQT